MEKLKMYVVLSFVFATILFFGGILLGYSLQGSQIDNANQNMDVVNEQLNQMETMILMNSVNKNLTCEYLENSIGTVYTNMEKVRVQVANIEKDVKLRNANDYDNLVEHLINLRVKYWLIGESIRDNCDPNVTTVLYFYSVNTKCISCNVMGVELSQITSKCRNVIVAPIPIDSKDELAKLLVKNYNVTSAEAPVLIIDQKERVTGLIPESNLTELLCNH